MQLLPLMYALKRRSLRELPTSLFRPYTAASPLYSCTRTCQLPKQGVNWLWTHIERVVITGIKVVVLSMIRQPWEWRVAEDCRSLLITRVIGPASIDATLAETRSKVLHLWRNRCARCLEKMRWDRGGNRSQRSSRCYALVLSWYALTYLYLYSAFICISGRAFPATGLTTAFAVI
jgi:hypothetical protein